MKQEWSPFTYTDTYAREDTKFKTYICTSILRQTHVYIHKGIYTFGRRFTSDETQDKIQNFEQQ